MSDFLGSSMKFPPQINKSTGRFEISSGKDSIKESIYIILMTNKGERWLEPAFGSYIMSYTFMDTSTTMLSIMENEIKSTILEQEPRVNFVEIDIENRANEGMLIINISYNIIETNTLDNLVFPFFLEDSLEGFDEAQIYD